jgi:hypothetical protein
VHAARPRSILIEGMVALSEMLRAMSAEARQREVRPDEVATREKEGSTEKDFFVSESVCGKKA